MPPDAARVERCVLLLGSSLYSSGERGEGDTVPSLLLRRLERLAPAMSWRCASEVVYESSSTLHRVIGHLERHKPDVLVFDLGTYVFIHAAVLTSVRRRWPALYPAVAAAMTQLKRLGGNSFDGGRGRRGLVFRLPRKASLALIGAETEQAASETLRFATEALDELLRREDLILICSLPKFYWHEPDQDRCLRDYEFAQITMRDYCARHHIPTYDLLQELRLEGREPRLMPDGLHFRREVNEFEADLIAQRVMAALGLTAAIEALP